MLMSWGMLKSSSWCDFRARSSRCVRAHCVAPEEDAREHACSFRREHPRVAQSVRSRRVGIGPGGRPRLLNQLAEHGSGRRPTPGCTARRGRALRVGRPRPCSRCHPGVTTSPTGRRAKSAGMPRRGPGQSLQRPWRAGRAASAGADHPGRRHGHLRWRAVRGPARRAVRLGRSPTD